MITRVVGTINAGLAIVLYLTGVLLHDDFSLKCAMVAMMVALYLEIVSHR